MILRYNSRRLWNSKKQPCFRYDGTEQASEMIGNLLSPILFAVSGFVGSFGVGLALNLVAIVYLIFFTEEPIER